jgi:hypothetical protein
VANCHAVNFFGLAVRKLVNIGVAVSAPQIPMWAVNVQIFSYIQEFKLSFLVMITESAILVTEQAILFIKSNCRCTAKDEHC